MKTIKRKLFILAVVFTLFILMNPVYGANEIPRMINYQGFFMNNNTPYDGDGYFKFSIIDDADSPTVNYWTNDGVVVGAGEEPASGVTVTVSDGIANVVLGDTTITNMTEISPDVFADINDSYLRIWFSEDGSSYTQVAAGRQFVSVPYAYSVELAPNSGLEYDTANGGLKIQDGGISEAMLDTGAVTEDKIDDEAVTSDQIAEDAVDTVEIVDDAVTTAKIEDYAITSDKILEKTITNEHLSLVADIDSSKIAGTAATLTGDQNFDSNTLFIDADNNNIGIRTENPYAHSVLDIQGGDFDEEGGRILSISGNFINDGGFFDSKRLYGLYLGDLTFDPEAADTESSLCGAYIKPSTAMGCPYSVNYLCGLEIETRHNGEGNAGFLTGMDVSVVKNNNSSEVVRAYGIKTQIVGTAFGEITDAYGLYVDGNTGESIINNYGIYIGDADEDITNSYALYQAGEDDWNYFAGDVGIGSGNESARLNVDAGTWSEGGGKILRVEGTFEGDSLTDQIGIDATELYLNNTDPSDTPNFYGAKINIEVLDECANPIGDLYGIHTYVEHLGDGDAEDVYGMYSMAKVTGAGADEVHAIKTDITVGLHHVDNAYGLYLDSIMGHPNYVDNKYGIYQEGTADKNYFAGNVGIGTTSPEGALDVSSTTQGFIVPRMTTTQRDALTAVNGMIIYNTTDNLFNFYENGNWEGKLNL